MSENFTLEKMMLYMYDEGLKLDERKQLAAQLQSNLNLKEEFDKINETRVLINKCFVSPSKQIISNILNYSRSTAGVKTSLPGLSVVMLN